MPGVIVKLVKEEEWQPPRLTTGEKWQLILSTMMGYACMAADFAAAQQYLDKEKGEWWGNLTMALVFIPGGLQCLIQHCTVYKVPAEPPVPGTIPVGERPPKFKRYRPNPCQYFGLWIVTLFSFRSLWEMIWSFVYGFQTGPWRDARIIQTFAHSMPQIALQTYILFVKFYDHPFSFIQPIVSLCINVVNVLTVPNGSPCCTDNRSLVQLTEDFQSLEMEANRT